MRSRNPRHTPQPVAGHRLRIAGGASAGSLVNLADRVPELRAPERSGESEPYGVRFVDIGKHAALAHEVVYGGVEQVKYIVEANGCGVAFCDCGNDGWLDIFVLNGSRLEGFPRGPTCVPIYRGGFEETRGLFDLSSVGGNGHQIIPMLARLA